jgi:hypothetical protein
LKKPAASKKDNFPKRIGPVSGPVRFDLVVKTGFCRGTSARVRDFNILHRKD